MDRRGIVVGKHAQDKVEAARRMRREPTAAEAALWAHLRRSRLAGLHFRRQQVIDGFIVDFYCHGASLVIELDGGIHEAQQPYDAERTAVLTRRGLRVLRFGNGAVLGDMDAVLDAILAAAQT